MVDGSPIGLLMSLTHSTVAPPVPTFTPFGIVVGTLSTTESLSDSPNTPILKGEIDNKNLNDSNNQININTTSTER